MRGILAALAGAALLSGCATELMSEKECLAGDWYGAGLEDGAEGRLPGAFDERAGLCAGYGAGADYETYAQGRALAIGRLCNQGGGYAYGRSGKSYLGVCPVESEPAFLGGYLEGWRINRAERARASAESAYTSAVYLANGYREDMRRARRTLRDEEATEKQRKRARRLLQDARRQLPYAERDVNARLYELGRADEELQQVIASSQSWTQSWEFEAMFESLIEGHDFARAEEAIDHCTDDGGVRLRCALLPGAALRDRANGGVCAAGPGEARFAGRRRDADGASSQSFEFYPRDGEGRLSRRPAGGFTVYFDQEGAYQGVSCSGAPY